MAVAFFIMCNAIVMCFEVQYDGLQIGYEMEFRSVHRPAADTWPQAKIVFAALDWLFGTIFFLEAALKLSTSPVQYFYIFWNWLDFISVVAFVIDKIASAIGGSLLNAQVLRLIRLFRLVRLIRLIRTLEHLDILYIMTTAIKGMRMIVVWSIALLFVILMTCALFLSQFLQTTYFGKDFTGASSADMTTRKELYKYFGTFSRCLLSMFEMTLANWPPVTRLLTEEISEWFSVICVVHKITIGFAVLGVINGVILQETFKVAHTDDMVMVRQKKRQKDLIERKMEALFQALDLDRDGELHFPEFMIIAAQPEVKLWLESLDIETDDLLTLFLLLDHNGDGSLTLDELLAHVPRLRGSARGIDMLALRKGIPAFQMMEEENGSPNEKSFKWTQSPKATLEGLSDTVKVSAADMERSRNVGTKLFE
jgi:Ca2+-binding EF-hand superfamily protein